MQLRLAKPEDIPEILDIYAPYITDTTVSFEYVVPSLEQFRARYDGITKQFPWLVCEVDGIVAGYAYASKAFERAAYQWNADIAVYIHEKYQRRGIASAFYRCVEELLRLQGYHRLYALVTSENRTSMDFHIANGYEQFAVFRDSGFKYGKWLDVIWYEKVLKPCEGIPQPPRAFPTMGRSEVQPVLDACSEALQRR